MADKAYQIKEIRAAWEKYNTMSVVRVLKAGKWQYTVLEGKGIPHFDGARAETCHPSDYMGFPKFLEELWQKKQK